MSYRTNNRMNSFVNELAYDYKVKLIDLPRPLIDFLNSPIVTSNGCFLIAQLCEKAPSNLSDLARSEFEYSENHFHPDSFVDEQLEDLSHLKLGLECSKLLASRLSQEFSNLRFRILLSYSQTEKASNEIEAYASSTLRFYQIRSVIDSVMRVGDLNAFESESMLEIETPVHVPAESPPRDSAGWGHG
jgi:hypothetical protein